MVPDSGVAKPYGYFHQKRRFLAHKESHYRRFVLLSASILQPKGLIFDPLLLNCAFGSVVQFRTHMDLSCVLIRL